MREEALSVLIASMLMQGVDFNFEEIVKDVAKLLDDSKSKIRHVATETLATISKVIGSTRVLELLMPIVDELAFKVLQERFKN